MTDDSTWLANFDRMMFGIRQAFDDHPYAVTLLRRGSWALIIDRHGVGLTQRVGTDPVGELGAVLATEIDEHLRGDE